MHFNDHFNAYFCSMVQKHFRNLIIDSRKGSERMMRASHSSCQWQIAKFAHWTETCYSVTCFPPPHSQQCVFLDIIQEMWVVQLYPDTAPIHSFLWLASQWEAATTINLIYPTPSLIHQQHCTQNWAFFVLSSVTAHRSYSGPFSPYTVSIFYL